MNNTDWYRLTIKEVIETLGTGESGLTTQEARARLLKFGPNQIREGEKASPWKIFLGQFKSFLILVLIIAAVISAMIGKHLEAIAIMAIVILAGGLGFVQEYQAERALEALKKMAALKARVIREGQEKEIAASDLVPGDVISLRTGDRVAADARLLEAINLKVDEASLTGESQAVDKSNQVIQEQNVSLGDRNNMVFMGTNVTYGRGQAVVVATGMQTEFGKIAQMLGEIEEKQTPLQISIDRVARWIGIFALTVSLLVGLLGVIQGHPLLEMFVWTVALAVAIVPEALPAVMTMTLAIGVHRMVKRHALIRKLQAVETLGAVSIICSDKTGTLTEDQMTVRKIWANHRFIEVSGAGYEPSGNFSAEEGLLDSNDEHLKLLLSASVLCNDSQLSNEKGLWTIKGDPTEGALVVAATKAKIDVRELRRKIPRMDEIPFSSERKRMTTIHLNHEGNIAYSKGAVEIILQTCDFIYQEGKEREITPKDKEVILKDAYSMSQESLRVLGIAYRKLDSTYSKDEVEFHMVFLGAVGMIDPPRRGVKEAVESCRKAGIKVIMITGDHKLTAVAIAQELGILENGRVLTGTELDALTEKEFERIVEDVQVYARVSPAHKLRIIDALAKKGKVVAMTGDGVNDAPALKKADIGVAMGITGTDVSKEASAMILTDDNFVSIVKAVEEGRTIFANIRKFLTYLLAGNMGAVFAYVVALLLKLPLPLTALQILYINLIMDGPKAVALGLEPPEPGIMEQPPRNPKVNIFSRQSLGYILGGGFWIGVVALGVFVWTLGSGSSGDFQRLSEHQLQYAMTMFFVTLTMVRTFHAFNCRSMDTSVFKLGLLSNKWLILAFFVTILTILPILYVPFLQNIFKVVPLNLKDWLIATSVSVTVLIVVEIVKLLQRARRRTSQR
ncbi:MAG: Calcium-transporting ATPase 1 [Syntrophomonadaceae bacterium]|nr:Calcium-transporting ATPase 1 [Bacillota bacterium]